MPWRDAQALHIFVPPQEPYGDNWVEQILGTTVRPLYQQFSDAIRWMWVTRYSGPYNNNALPLGYPIPEPYHADGRYRFIVFRVSVISEFQQEIQEQAIRRATDSGCLTDPRGWVDYDVVTDLGSNRFIKANATDDERASRAKLVANYVDATIKLMIESLVQDEEGKWKFEGNQSEQNPNGSIFESIHHLFCNATFVPTTALVACPANQIMIRTHWMSPLLLNLEPNKFVEVRLQY